MTGMKGFYMRHFSSQLWLPPALVVGLVALLFVACGVPDPAAAPLATDADPSPVALAAPRSEPVVTPTATTTADDRCAELLYTYATMDRATLEGCVAVVSTALAQVAPTCPAGFDISAITDDALSEYCGGLRETASALDEVGSMLTPIPPGPTETPNLNTPVPLNYIPDRYREVRPVPGEDRIGLRFLRDATSVWQLGSLNDISGYNYNAVWVWTKPPGAGADRATIGFVIMGDAQTKEGPIYRMIWEAPEDVGALTITVITGVTLEREQVAGLLAFTTSTGRSGAFDLATQQWSFAP